jgi:ornithine carbamoyltransferase
VPVINGLTKVSHPCQIMADVLTFEEHRGSIAGRTAAWVGDANNVLASWVHAAARFGFTINAATPAALAPDPALIDWARANNVAFNVTRDPREAVKGADVVVTDCWVSMGDKDEDFRRQTLAPYQVNTKLMHEAAKEVTDAVIDGPQSVDFDEAENRLHAQKAVLACCLAPDFAG